MSVPVRPRGSQARVNRAESFYICIYIYIYILKVSVRRLGYLAIVTHLRTAEFPPLFGDPFLKVM